MQLSNLHSLYPFEIQKYSSPSSVILSLFVLPVGFTPIQNRYNYSFVFIYLFIFGFLLADKRQ
jgi:hypothetical protein